ncbi:MAG: phosphoenolpyruvate--protein phosphotransferase [Alphaproteobacteria bacterium]
MLRAVRDAVALEAPAAAKLAQASIVIAEALSADVCSLYLRQRDGAMALAATHGLRPDAVFNTRLAPGEGLVGLAAASTAPIEIHDVQRHPAFAYRPETGEDPYSTFLGAPLLRGGAAGGVLVIQHLDDQAYSDDDIEAIAIVAALMAEVAADPEFSAFVAAGADAPTARLIGQRLSPGLAIGVAALRDPPLPIQRMITEDTAEEIKRLDRGVARMRRELDNLLDDPSLTDAGEHRDVLDAFRLAASDDAWIRRIRGAIERGMTAEVAARRVQTEARIRMRRAQSAYLRDRLADLDDLAGRLMRGLATEAGDVGLTELPENAILFAHALGPAELLELDRSRLLGLVVEEGSSSSHVAVVARALQLPVIGGVSGALAAVQPGDLIILDADRGQALLRPAPQVRAGFEIAVASRAARTARYATTTAGPTVTRDGAPIAILANAGLLMDVETAVNEGAEGIGLFRTELSFLGQQGLPSVDEQIALYREARALANNRPVAFRTFDHGGDKTPATLAGVREANPALGWRALRIALDRPETLRSQLYALAVAAAGEQLDVMFPMAAEAAEIAQARAILRGALEQAASDGLAPRKVRVGVAIETPSLVWQGATALRRVDFATVGTNDLLQFTFAADRDGVRMAERYDSVSPPALAMLRHVVQAAAKANTPLSICGEMAGDPLAAIALIGLGIRSLSVAPGAVNLIRDLVASVDASEAALLVDELIESEEHSVRDQVREFAEAAGLTFDDGY